MHRRPVLPSSPTSPETKAAAAAVRRRPVGRSAYGVNEDDLIAVDPRYVHLIEPIRDLVKNFRIDIAAELEDYLDELSDVTFALDGDNAHRQLNFAEAALLIQGSACVYARKVEYLTQLLFRALEEVHSRREKKKRSRKADELTQAKGQKDDTADEAEKADILFSIDDFISLDDLPQAAAEELDLDAAGFEAAAKPTKRYVWQDDDDTADFLREIDRRSSLGVAIGHLAPLKPGDKDVRLAGEMDAFRLNTLPTTDNGGLRLHGDMFEINSHPLGRSNQADEYQPPSLPLGADDGFDDGFGDHGEAPVFDVNSAFDELNFERDDPEGANIVSEHMLGLGKEELAKMPIAEVRRRLAEHRTRPINDQENELESIREDHHTGDDLWTFHDIHEEAKPSQIRPRRLGKTHKLPPSLHASKEGKLESTVSQLIAFTLTHKQSVVDAKARGKLSVAQWPEFDYAFARLARKRADLLRKFRLLDPITQTFPILHGLTPTRRSGDKNTLRKIANHYEKFDMDDGYRAAGIAAPDADDFAVSEFDEGFDDEHFNFEAPTYSDPFQSGPVAGIAASQVEAPGGTGAQYTRLAAYPDTFGDPNTISYAELCRRHIDQYMRAAEEAISLSRLQEEVADWQERIEPTLECIEGMPHFSISEYGQRIVAAFGNSVCVASSKKVKRTTEDRGNGDNSSMTLSDLCRALVAPTDASGRHSTHSSKLLNISVTHYSGDVPQFDVCRSFVAALQLVNNGNIELEPMNVDDEGTAHDLSLRLLDANLVNANARTRMLTSDNALLSADDEFMEHAVDSIEDYDAFIVTQTAANALKLKDQLSQQNSQSLQVQSSENISKPLSSPGGSQTTLPASKSPVTKRTRSFGTLLQDSSQQ